MRSAVHERLVIPMRIGIALFLHAALSLVFAAIFFIVGRFAPNPFGLLATAIVRVMVCWLARSVVVITVHTPRNGG